MSITINTLDVHLLYTLQNHFPFFFIYILSQSVPIQFLLQTVLFLRYILHSVVFSSRNLRKAHRNLKEIRSNFHIAPTKYWVFYPCFLWFCWLLSRFSCHSSIDRDLSPEAIGAIPVTRSVVVQLSHSFLMRCEWTLSKTKKDGNRQKRVIKNWYISTMNGTVIDSCGLLQKRNSIFPAQFPKPAPLTMVT